MVALYAVELDELLEVGFTGREVKRVEDMLKEECLAGDDTRFKASPGFIEGNLVRCTGAEFCGLALIETKANAEALAKELESKIKVDRPVRIHWTGW